MTYEGDRVWRVRGVAALGSYWGGSMTLRIGLVGEYGVPACSHAARPIIGAV